MFAHQNVEGGRRLSTELIHILAVEGIDSEIESRRVQSLLAKRGYQACIRAVRQFRLQGDFDLDALMPLFVNFEKGERLIPPASLHSDTSVVEVAYRPSVSDPETQSVLDAAALKGISGLDGFRCSWVYQMDGVTQDEAERITAQLLFNPIVQLMVAPGVYEDSLIPTGTPAPMEYYDFTGLTPEELVRLSREKRWNAPLEQLLVLQQYQSQMGRLWRDAEVEQMMQFWSDHCYHTTMKALDFLRRLKEAIEGRNDPLVASFLEGNAGAIYFYDGLLLLLKGETHNHPFALAALGAILTMLGGLIRDILYFALGGEVLGISQIIATRPPHEDTSLIPPGAPEGRVLVPEAIAGVGGYGNPMGYSNMAHKYRWDPQYTKPMGLGVALGIGPASILNEQEPQEGDLGFIEGGRTGRDGLHGATGSSGGLSAEIVAKEAAEVQIGHPIIERCLATFVVLTRHLVRKRTDMGAGGIACAFSELCRKCGIDIDLDKVLLNDQSLEDWEVPESESQERGASIVPPENREEYLALARLCCVEVSQVGRCRNDGRLVMTRGGRIVSDLDLRWVWSACPIPERELRDPGIVRMPAVPSEVADGHLTPEHFNRWVSDNTVCDQSYAGRQFDQSVQGNTVIGSLINNIIPSSAAVFAPVPGKPYGAVYTESFVHRWSKSDPVGSVRANTALAISRMIAVGVEPKNFAGGANWYVPTRTPEQMWTLKQMSVEMIRMMSAFDFSWIVGKDSCGGEFTDADGNKIAVPFTFVPSFAGRMPDISRIRTCVFQHPGDHIYAIRPATEPNLGGSVVLDIVGRGQSDYLLPSPNEESAIPALWGAIAESYPNFSSVTAVGEGGAFVQALFGALGSGLGADIVLPVDRIVWDLGGEPVGGFLVTISDMDRLAGSQLIAGCSSGNFEIVRLGVVTRRQGLSIVADQDQILCPDNWPQLVHTWKTVFEKEVTA